MISLLPKFPASESDRNLPAQLPPFVQFCKFRSMYDFLFLFNGCCDGSESMTSSTGGLGGNWISVLPLICSFCNFNCATSQWILPPHNWTPLSFPLSLSCLSIIEENLEESIFIYFLILPRSLHSAIIHIWKSAVNKCLHAKMLQYVPRLQVVIFDIHEISTLSTGYFITRPGPGAENTKKLDLEKCMSRERFKDQQKSNNIRVY